MMLFIRAFFLFFLLSISQGVLAQDFKLDSIVVLQNEIPESSGLMYKDGVIITHNDSGDGPYLYEIDTLTGLVARRVYIADVTAVDWEDLAADDTYLYIGDIGNNFGNRADLAIYRLAWKAYSESDTVTVERIAFNYAEQTDFSLQLGTTPFDAETLMATDDNLYLFTKDWSNINQSKIYQIPKEPGEYTVAAIDSIDTPGLLTGLAYLSASQTLLFVGYDLVNAFVLEWSEVVFDDFSNATTRTWPLPLEGSFKTEAITFHNNRYAYISKERNSLGEGVLYRLDTDFTTQVTAPTSEIIINIFPNPATKDYLIFQIQIPDELLAESRFQLSLFDSQGKEVHQEAVSITQGTVTHRLEVSDLSSGIYFYELRGTRKLSSGKILLK